jgi:RNA polymerase sigma-70 factor (ECF subfamily)
MATDDRYIWLLCAISGKDEAALEELWLLTSARLRRYVLRMLTDDWVAEEVIQDVFRQVWLQAATYDPNRAGPCAWLYNIARSRAFDALRRQKRHAGQENLDSQTGLSVPGNPESECAARALRQRMVTAMTALPPNQQMAISLAFYEGYTHSEIAAEMGVPLGTIKTRIRSALSRIGESFCAADLAQAA